MLTTLSIELRHSQFRMQGLRSTETSPSRKNNCRGRAALGSGMSTSSTSRLLYTYVDCNLACLLGDRGTKRGTLIIPIQAICPCIVWNE